MRVHENQLKSLRERLAHLQSAAQRSCEALSDLQQADEYWNALEQHVAQRAPEFQLDLQKLADALGSLHLNDLGAFATALRHWGFRPPAEAGNFVHEQLGRFIEAARLGVASVPPHELLASAKMGIELLRNEVCREDFLDLAKLLLQRQATGRALLGAGLKILSRVFLGRVAASLGGALMLLSVIPEDLYSRAEKDRGALPSVPEHVQDLLLVVGLALLSPSEVRMDTGRLA
jgi:hypothetical protein